MATIQVPRKVPPKVINRFLGLNENQDGEYGLKLGEASKMLNFRITPNYQLKKRDGFWKVFNFKATLWDTDVWDTGDWDIDDTTNDIQGMWHGKLNGATFFLFCCNGHLYSGNLTDGTKTDLGTLTDAPTRFIAFGSKVYLFNGHEYKSFDGTTFQTVTGYRPKIAIGAPPSGGGTLYEQVNELTGSKHMTFTPSGSATQYVLPEQNIDSVDFVKVNGLLKTLTTDYTVDLAGGKVNFVTGPTGAVPDSVDIGWTKGTGNRQYIEKCRFAMDYSGQTDSRIFIWGDPDNKSRRRWSGIANGVPSAEYFEANSYNDEGSGEYAITDIVKQYDRQKIFLENGARYSYYESVDIDGVTTATFPSFELNEEVGNLAEGQVQVVNNSPFTLYAGIVKWQGSTVRDQTNETLISQRVQDSLIEADLSKAVTVNWNEKKEYWCNIGSDVWIYNYLNDVWYKFNNINATCFLVVKGELYFGSNGSIYKFDGTKATDNGIAINAEWEMGFYDFDAEWLAKYMNNIWISIKPAGSNSVDIQTDTNVDGRSLKQTISYKLATFEHADFSDWSFNTNYNPQPFYLEVTAMNFCYFKIILSNSSPTDTVTVLSINMPIRYGGAIR